ISCPSTISCRACRRRWTSTEPSSNSASCALRRRPPGRLQRCFCCGESWNPAVDGSGIELLYSLNLLLLRSKRRGGKLMCCKRCYPGPVGGGCLATVLIEDYHMSGGFHECSVKTRSGS